VELNAQPGRFGGRMTEAIIANGAQAPGKNVPQEARDKLLTWQGHRFAAVFVCTIFPTESDRILISSAS
jgi:hypothetical protein